MRQVGGCGAIYQNTVPVLCHRTMTKSTISSEYDGECTAKKAPVYVAGEDLKPTHRRPLDATANDKGRRPSAPIEAPWLLCSLDHRRAVCTAINTCWIGQIKASLRLSDLLDLQLSVGDCKIGEWGRRGNCDSNAHTT